MEALQLCRCVEAVPHKSTGRGCALSQGCTGESSRSLQCNGLGCSPNTEEWEITLDPVYQLYSILPLYLNVLCW